MKARRLQRDESRFNEGSAGREKKWMDLRSVLS